MSSTPQSAEVMPQVGVPHQLHRFVLLLLGRLLDSQAEGLNRPQLQGIADEFAKCKPFTYPAGMTAISDTIVLDIQNVLKAVAAGEDATGVAQQVLGDLQQCLSGKASTSSLPRSASVDATLVQCTGDWELIKGQGPQCAGILTLSFGDGGRPLVLNGVPGDAVHTLVPLLGQRVTLSITGAQQ